MFNLYNAGVAVNYNLDLFGHNRRFPALSGRALAVGRDGGLSLGLAWVCLLVRRRYF